MSFKDDFVEYSKKTKIEESKLWSEYACLKRIPYVVIGLTETVYQRVEREVLEGLHIDDKKKIDTLYKKVYHHYHTSFNGTKSLRTIRRRILKRLLREVHNEKSI